MFIMIIATKIKTIFLSVIIIFLTLGATILINKQNTSTKQVLENSPRLGITVVLDAGHGGIDPGSVGKTTKVTEAEINLKIVKKLEKLLLAGGIDTILTRSDENGLYGIYTKDYKIKDMKARKEIILASNADLVISVHQNSFIHTKYRGAQVFYDDINPSSTNLALCVQKCFTSDLPKSNKGTAIGDYYILKCAPQIPSILCECGYLSNKEDETLLVSDDYQNNVAYSIYKGIIAYLNNK